MTMPAQEQRPTILVADDDRLILFTLVEGLEEAGFKVLQAQDGLSALDMCIRHAPDLALLDIRMPGLDGLELAQRLQSQTQVPFLFFSAFSDEDYVKKAVAAGAYGYLLKPLSVEAMVPTLWLALAKAREHTQQQAAQLKLQGAIESNRLIGTAVGLVMREKRLDRQQAFDFLRSIARRERLKLEQVANKLVNPSVD